VEPAFPEVRSTGWTWENREAHYRRWLPPAAYVITGASALSEDLSRCYGISPRRIRVLPLVAPTRNASAREQSSGKPFLFYPAQFWPHKNHVGLLHALKEVREKHGLDLDLVLCGSDKGNLSYIRETVAALGLQSSVRILGFVPDDELTALYQGATALVFPSFFGPDNLPPLEAMQLGCPVIAADVPGAHEQLGDAALLVDPRNPTDIASAIARLVRDSQLRDTLVARGRERVARWQPKDYAAGIVRIVDEFETESRCWSSTTEYVHT
jgi:glycosyltransferase involved in cell wall biosynthesis